MTEKQVDLDDVLVKFDIFGKYHFVKLILVFIANLSNIMFSYNYVFAAEQVEYRCNDTRISANATCSNELAQCTEWVYDNPHSFVAEFQLACQEWKRTFVGTVHSFGYMIGLILIGPMSDRLGRKAAIVLTGVAGGLLGVARSFTTWYWLYIALEFLEAAIGDICSPIFMLAVEIVATKKRVPFLTLTNLGYSFGGMTLALVAWLVPYWRNYLRVIYAPALLFFLYKYLIDESPRWLLSKGRRIEAKEIIERAAVKNKIVIDSYLLDKLSYEEKQDVNFIELLKSTFSSLTLLKRFFICVSWWATSTFVNYGLMINSVSLQGNKYVNFALLALIEMPGVFILMLILKYLKRKFSLILSFMLTAVLCLMQPFVPNNLPWLSIVLYMVGKLMSGFYFGITYIFTSELFPTYTRNSMHALCSSLGRIGSIIAPQTPLLMVYWPGLPSIVFGTVSLLAGLVTFLVPDTADDSLPDNVEQAKALGKQKVKEDKMNGNNHYKGNCIYSVTGQLENSKL